MAWQELPGYTSYGTIVKNSPETSFTIEINRKPLVKVGDHKEDHVHAQVKPKADATVLP
jgi:hypothetical protein